MEIDPIVTRAFDPYVVAATVGATASLAAVAVTNILKLREDRKKRNINVITQRTSDYKENCKRCAAQILASTHPLLLLDPKIPGNKEILVQAMSEFELTIRIGTGDAGENKDGVEINNAMRELVKTFLRVEKGEGDISDLEQKHDNFRELMSAFDSACWKYIKNQSDGKIRKGIFTGIYRSERECIQCEEKPQTWI